LHGYLMSNGAVKPRIPGVTGPGVSATAQTKTGAAPTQPGQEPLRPGRTPTGAQATPTSAE
jgi:biopolymer transport protein ExbB